ncbi:MAG: winged helix-turn-helix domain-containing protein [Candidatus Nanohaloarchaea archaeon]|nr:winged helix-turn-helix domain-containing protein [Candidatus Nanohaloarchaea archaeon]
MPPIILLEQMELDLTTIKALSAPTRIRILRALDNEAKTPTALSDDLNKSKSTIVNHLDVLCEADWLTKKKGDDASPTN